MSAGLPGAPLDADILARKRRLDALRPLSPAGVRALDEWYDVEITFSSNALEGNSLTRSETAVILDKGIAIGASRSRTTSKPSTTATLSPSSGRCRRPANRSARAT